MTINEFRKAASGMRQRFVANIGGAVKAYLAEIHTDLSATNLPKPDEANNQPPRFGLHHNGRRHSWWERQFGSKWLSWPALRWPNRKPPEPLVRNVVYGPGPFVTYDKPLGKRDTRVMWPRDWLRAWGGVRNSEMMEKRWVQGWEQAALRGFLGNPATYAPYCHDDEQRTVVMRRRGWPSVGEAQQRAQDVLDTEITALVAATMKGTP